MNVNGIGQISRRANAWRDGFNPCRALTLGRAVALLEAYDRGQMADVQWTFRKMERIHPDLHALLNRRLSAITEMDWDIKQSPVDSGQLPEAVASSQLSVVGAPPSTGNRQLATAQAAALRAAYERIDNLCEAIEHLALAVFRGFSHLQKQARANSGLMVASDPRCITHLEPVDQWNVVRNGSAPEWKYNAEARETTFAALPESCGLDVTGFRHYTNLEGIKHIDKEHGVGREKQADHEPVTRDDILKIPEIVHTADSIEDGGLSNRGRPTVKYAKKYGATTYYVEEVWSHEKVLATKTMFKKKTGSGKSATPEGGVSHTS